MGCDNCQYLQRHPNPQGLSICTAPGVQKHVGNTGWNPAAKSLIARNDNAIEELGIRWEGSDWLAFPFNFDPNRISSCAGKTPNI